MIAISNLTSCLFDSLQDESVTYFVCLVSLTCAVTTPHTTNNGHTAAVVCSRDIVVIIMCVPSPRIYISNIVPQLVCLNCGFYDICQLKKEIIVLLMLTILLYYLVEFYC